MRDNGFVGVSNIVNEWLENRFSISNAGARMHGCRCHHFAILHIAPHFSFVMKGLSVAGPLVKKVSFLLLCPPTSWKQPRGAGTRNTRASRYSATVFGD